MRTGTGARFVPADVRIVRGAVSAVGLDQVLRVDPRTDAPTCTSRWALPPESARHRHHRGVRLGLSAEGRLMRYDTGSGRASGADASAPRSRPTSSVVRRAG